MDDSSKAQLQEALAGRYAVERELGRGGMATVYLATDLKHGRQVAIKLLRPELAAAVGPERFLREIQIAAGLNHPHILPLHDSGTLAGDGQPLAGRPYYVMPYVEGESLRERLDREGQLPLEDALGLAAEVADALDYAHRHGVVHRDIKPENILLADGHALIADFGIARAVGAAGTERLTETGLSVGTPAYMSPEQSAGSAVDGRADLYALGCVLYEMLAGAPPYLGPNTRSVLARHALDPIPPVRTVRPTVPIQVEQAITRALAKTPADRFATGALFARAMTSPVAVQPRRVAIRARHLIWGLAAVAAGALGFQAFRWLGRPAITVDPSAHRIAVLPLLPVTPDTALERLGRDLVVTLSANLDGVGDIQTIDALTVLAQTPSGGGLAARDQAAALAGRLGATGLVRGTLARDGQNVRLDLALYDVNGQTKTDHLFVVADPAALTALTDSASWALLREVWRAGPPPSPSLAAITTSSIPALRDFLAGERAIVDGRWDLAEAAFRRSVEVDSTFWLAHWRHAWSRWWLVQARDSASWATARAHIADLPERERRLAEAWRTPTGDQRFTLGREMTERFPHYWPGWLEYADELLHRGPLHGHSMNEARQAFIRLTELNPRLVPAWDHLIIAATTLADTALLGQSLERTYALAPATTADDTMIRQFRELNLRSLQGRPFVGPLADSLVEGMLSHPQSGLKDWSRQWFLPADQVTFSHRILSRTTDAPLAAAHRKGLELAWAERGAWDSALAAVDAIEEYARAHPAVLAGMRPGQVARSGASSALARLEAYRLAVVGAWLGALDPGLASARRSGALEAVRERDDPRGEPELAWLDGVLAVSQRDRPALADARRHLATVDTSNVVTEPYRRSLAAFDMALAGRRRAAGDSMAALLGNQPFRIPAPYFLGINSLAAARWLAAEGEPEQATRLLQWPQAVILGNEPFWSGRILTGVTYLELGRIEAARRHEAAARWYFQQFLLRADAPSGGMLPLVEQAHRALAALD